MSRASDKRHIYRVKFERGFPARIMALDGTWFRGCLIEDVSDEGAKLTIKDSLAKLNLTQFFLVLSSNGLAYRHCELAWIEGDSIGVKFLREEKTKSNGPARFLAR